MLKTRLLIASSVSLLAVVAAHADMLLRDVRTLENEVRLYLSDTVDYKAFRLDRPSRIVIDLLRTQHEGKPRNLDVGFGLLAAVRTDQYVSPPLGVTRVVIVLGKPAKYSVDQQNNVLTLKLIEAPGDLKDSIAGRLPITPAVGILGAAGGIVPRKIVDRSASEESAWLEDIDVGPDAAAVYLSKHAEFRALYLHAPPRLVMDFIGVKRRRWIGRRSPESGVLLGVRTGLLSTPQEPVTRVVFDLRNAAPYTTVWQDNILMLEFQDAETAAEPETAEEAGIRQYAGLLLDSRGNGINGSHQLRFFWPGNDINEFWSESLLINAQQGFFETALGKIRPLPLEADVDVAVPPGSGWRVINTTPRP